MRDSLGSIHRWYSKILMRSMRKRRLILILGGTQTDRTMDWSPKRWTAMRSIRCTNRWENILKWNKENAISVECGCVWCEFLPKNALSRIGRRPYLSDHGPMKKPIKAGIIFSKIARDIKTLVAYFSTSVVYNAKMKIELGFDLKSPQLEYWGNGVYVQFDWWTRRWLNPCRMSSWMQNRLCTLEIGFDFGTPLRSDSMRRIRKAPATPMWLCSDLASGGVPRWHHFDRHFRLYCTTAAFRHRDRDAIGSWPLCHYSRQPMDAS